ncbi:MAG: hypothetical protein ACE5HL_05840 [Terriglobia bacterium]
MQEAEEPKAFYYSAKALSFRRGMIIFTLFGLVAELLLWWLSERNNERLLVIGFLGLGAIALLFLFRRPVAMLYRDCAKLPGYWGLSLVEVPYSQIIALEKIPNNRLTVVYRRDTKTQKAHLPLRWVTNPEELETHLRTATGLEVQTYRPWWLRPFLALDSAIPLEEFHSWRFLGYTLVAGVVTGVVTVALLVLFVFILGWMPPIWLFVGVALTTTFGTLYFFVRRYRQRQERPRGEASQPRSETPRS